MRASYDQRLADALHLQLAVANAKCQLIRDGASGDPDGGAGYAWRVKDAARLWIKRVKRQGRNPQARLIIQEGRRLALEAAPWLAAKGADELIHTTASVALHIAQSQIAVWGDETGVRLNVDLAPIIESLVAGDLTWREALAAASAAVRDRGEPPEA
ncbi:MAG: hypothetical protein OXH20_03170 [bacterium]|nr:hypothetical protein [bacterium]